MTIDHEAEFHAYDVMRRAVAAANNAESPTVEVHVADLETILSCTRWMAPDIQAPPLITVMYIVWVLNKLTPAERARVMAWVNDEIEEGS